LYGVFDGHDGSRVSNFATQRMPAELLLGQLSNKMSNAEIEDTLRQVNIAPYYHIFLTI
jgi:TAK1-binding protein 1